MVTTDLSEPTIVLGWTLVAENKECDNGRDQDVGRWSDVSKCADRCRSKATMFTYEPNNQGYCRCQMAASAEGTCRTRNAPGKTLYKFNTGVKDMPVRSMKRSLRGEEIIKQMIK